MKKLFAKIGIFTLVSIFISANIASALFHPPPSSPGFTLGVGSEEPSAPGESTLKDPSPGELKVDIPSPIIPGVTEPEVQPSMPDVDLLTPDETGSVLSEAAKKEVAENIKQVELLNDSLADAKEFPCIQLTDDKKNPLDEGYIITIIEEPLILDQSGETTPKASYEERVCIRNTFSFTDTIEKDFHVATELSRRCNAIGPGCKKKFSGCSENGLKLFSNDELKNRYKITFACQEVQVILSKGGTSLIEGYIGTIYRWSAGLVGLIAVLLIIISGIQISAAGGDTQAVENAKNRIIQSIAGLVVLFLSGLILFTVNPNFFIR